MSQLVAVTCRLPASVTLGTESRTWCRTQTPFLVCQFASSFDLDPIFREANVKIIFSTKKRLGMNKNDVSMGRTDAISQCSKYPQKS